MSLGTIRLCYAPIPLIFDLDEQAGLSTELAARYVNCFFSKMRGFNRTFVRKNNFGDNKGGETYDGCIGSFQKNESDVGMLMTDLPVLGPNLTQGEVVGDDEAHILSFYNMLFMPNPTDVMDAFHGFTGRTWAAIVCMVVLFWIMMSLTMHVKESGKKKKKIKNEKNRNTKFPRKRLVSSLRRCFTLTWTNLLMQASSSGFNENISRKNFNFIFLLMILFVFMIRQYFSALIGTEMVVQEKPPTIQSYSDILQRNVRVVFLKQFNDHWEFERADKGSQAGKIWEQASRHKKGSFFEFDTEALRLLVAEGFTQSLVFVTGKVYGRAFMTNFCSFAHMNSIDYAMLYRKDAEAKQRLRGMVINSWFYNSKNVNIFLKRMKWNFEAAIETNALSKIEFSMFPDERRGSDPIRKCVANMVQVPDSQVRAPDLFHYKYLLYSVLALLVAASIVFSMERAVMDSRDKFGGMEVLLAPLRIDADRLGGDGRTRERSRSS